MSKSTGKSLLTPTYWVPEEQYTSDAWDEKNIRGTFLFLMYVLSCSVFRKAALVARKISWF